MAQQPKQEHTWDENCIKAGGIPFRGQDYRKYKPKGHFTEIASRGKDRMSKLPIYLVDPAKKDFHGVIIFIYDIFGWNKESKLVLMFPLHFLYL